jgi:hypothetical protein
MSMDGYTIFCDDIRHELFGKTSFIGVYGENMVIHGEFPVALPKFCMSIIIFVETDLSKIEDFKIYTEMPGSKEPAFAADIKIKDSVSKFISENKDISLEGRFKVGTNLAIAPLQLEEPGFIRVRAKTDKGRILKLGALKVVAGAGSPNA